MIPPIANSFELLSTKDREKAESDLLLYGNAFVSIAMHAGVGLSARRVNPLDVVLRVGREKVDAVNAVLAIQEQIVELQKRLEAIQQECSHPKLAVQSENKSNTGNYDPSSDSYWTDHHCTLCDKKWRVDQ